MQTMKAAGVTVIIITHRPRVVSGVDKMLVLRNGAVDMFGAAKTVMERLRITDATERPAALPPAERGAPQRAKEVG
jgi:ATP-binding cassette subfamily C protein/ATP-binding cassette subfamily C protein EexD